MGSLDEIDSGLDNRRDRFRVKSRVQVIIPWDYFRGQAQVHGDKTTLGDFGQLINGQLFSFKNGQK